MNIKQLVPIDYVPDDAYVVNSHVLYKKLKNNDGKSIALKARIAPHGNEEKDKDILTTNCQSCPPGGNRIVLSVASLKRWETKIADAKDSFLKTEQASSELYVIPHAESKMRPTHKRLLLV